MFGNKNRSDRELEAWIQSLESEDWDSPDLRAAQVLKSAQLNAVSLPESRRSALRQRLIDQHERRRTPFFVALRYALNAGWVALGAGLIVVGIQLVRIGVAQQAVSQLAEVVTILQESTTSQVIYQRAEAKLKGESPLMMVFGAPLYGDAILESWYTPDFASVRYQVTNKAGEILYFEQWHEEQWYYSVYDFRQIQQPITQFVQLKPQLVKKSIEAAGKQQMVWEDASWLHGMIELDWLRLNLLIERNRPHCNEPLCLLGVTQANFGWSCKDGICERKFSENEVYRVELKHDFANEKVFTVDVESVPSPVVRYRLLFDRQSMRLIEVMERHTSGAVGLAITADAGMERSASRAAFDEVPLHLSTTPYMMNLWNLPLSAQIRYRVSSVSPTPGISIDQPTQIKISIDYELSHYLSDLPFTVGLAARDEMPGQPMYHETTKFVHQRQGVITATLDVSPSLMRNTMWQLRAGSAARSTLFGDDLTKGLVWCIGCDPQLFPEIAITEVNPTVDSILIKGRTTSPNGTCYYSQLLVQLPSMGSKLVPWWPHDQCIEVNNRYWKIEVDLTRYAPDFAPNDGHQYLLRIWDRDHPEYQPTLNVGPLTVHYFAPPPF